MAQPAAEHYKLKDGTTKYKGRAYHKRYTSCPNALRNSWTHCHGHTKSGFDTRDEALGDAWKRQLELEHGSGLTATVDGNPTLDGLAQLWLASGPAGIGPKTLDGYRERWAAWNNRPHATIGLVPVAEVQTIDVVGWLSELRDLNLSQNTMRLDLILLRHIFRYAVTLGLRDTDPTEGLKAPTSKKAKPGKRPRLTEEQVWQVAERIGGQYRLAVLLGAYTGLRLGELLGLQAKRIARTTQPYLIDVSFQWDERRCQYRRPKRDKVRTAPVPPWPNHAIDKHLFSIRQESVNS